jgi:hypothetical protein
VALTDDTGQPRTVALSGTGPGVAAVRAVQPVTLSNGGGASHRGVMAHTLAPRCNPSFTEDAIGL